MATVTSVLRERKGGKKVCRIRINYGKHSEYETLSDLVIYKTPRTNSEKNTNDTNKRLIKARIEQIKSQLAIGAYGQLSEGGKTLLLDYVDEVVKHRGTSDKNRTLYKTVKRHIERFMGLYGYNPKTLTLANVTVKFCKDFKLYLASPDAPLRGQNYSIAERSQNTYFIRLCVILNDAENDGYIMKAPTKGIEAPKYTEVDKVFLTDEEVKTLESTPFRDEMLRRAFLFACYTGLRASDIESLRWNHFYEKDGSMHLKKVIRKGRKPLDILLASQAVSHLPQRRGSDERVFLGLRYDGNRNEKLKEWVFRAGIDKGEDDNGNKLEVTSHTARHTFAVKLINTEGITLKDVSEALAHKTVRETERTYAKVLKSTKDEAIRKAFG